MGNDTEIIGIVLVKNEDLFIEQVLRNILFFCDKIIVADNMSNDRTGEKIASLQCETQKIEYHRIRNAGKSHDFISKYADQPRWIFAVDGDEIYDPQGLQTLRKRILSGRYDNRWMILGNVLHCVELSRDGRYVRGYLTPPCRSMTKLYNFSKIHAWNGPCPERLHGGQIRFKEGFSMSDRLLLYEKMSWENSFFRCLHLCFLSRSSREKPSPGKPTVRKNIIEINAGKFPGNILGFFKDAFTRGGASQYKRAMYMRGELIKKESRSFFPQRPGARQTEQ